MGIIINADDYGLSEHCTKAIAQAFRDGLITDTTMMATGKCFDEACRLAVEQGFADRIGVHFNLTEGGPLTEDIRQCTRFVTKGSFNKRYDRKMPLTKAEKAAIYRELTAQAQRIKNAPLTITHADSHHHIHTGNFIAPIVMRVCKEQGITKVRLHRNVGNISVIKRLVKNNYNRRLKRQGFITTDYFAFPADIKNTDIPDNTEVMVHPDYDKDGLLIDRKGFEDGIPFGDPLLNLRERRCITLTEYARL